MIHYTFRSFPCDKNPAVPHSQCQRCQAGNVPRWEGYVLGWCPSNGSIDLYRISPGNALIYEGFIERHTTLRGAVVTMNRGTKSNGKPTVGIMRGTDALGTLPANIDVWATLNLIWYQGKYREQNAADQASRPTNMQPLHELEGVMPEGTQDQGPRLADLSGNDHNDIELRAEEAFRKKSIAKSMAPAQIDAERAAHQAKMKNKEAS